MERAWMCAGFLTLVEPDLFAVREVVVVAGERPLLGLPAPLDDDEREEVYGWALAVLQIEREGWLGFYRAVLRYREMDPPAPLDKAG